MRWAKHGILPGVLRARYATLFYTVNARNVTVISGVMDSLLIRVITSHCARHVNMSNSFDKSTEFEHRTFLVGAYRYFWVTYKISLNIIVSDTTCYRRARLTF